MLAVNPDMALVPASNQKLLVAYAALELLGGPQPFVVNVSHRHTNRSLQATRHVDREALQPAPTLIATVDAAQLEALVRDTLRLSDNQIADRLVVALGRHVAGNATLASGLEAMDRALVQLMAPRCGSLQGVSHDGSGLSRRNRRSAREFQEILRAMRSTDSGRRVAELLPVGGVSGTLSSRFRSDAGRVAAKTGTLRSSRALSGYAVTDSGRDAVFSIIVNGERQATAASLPAIDALVTAILRS